MNQKHLSLPTRLFRLPMRQSLQAAQEAGARGVQLDLAREVNGPDWNATALKELQHYASELGLTLASGWLPLRKALFEDDGLDDRLMLIRHAIQLAGKLRLRTVCLRPGHLPQVTENNPAISSSKARKILEEVFSDLTRLADHHGVVLCIIPTADAPQSLKEFTNSITTGRLAIDFDSASFAMQGLSVSEAITSLHEQIGHVTLRDGIRDFQQGGLETPVGEGTIPWPEVIGTLEEVQFRGWLMPIRTQGQDPLGDTMNGLAYFRRMLPRG
ncbi:Xylose isomerase-like TIM barrel [Planctopirus ephydatiae]|uniref:Xylose isomerase-like TIM barrel n=2 Tax=Planctopirus ephydatiae TaxID=2528019 RepID=A0A518GQA1_9PLAN|nr:Xylose isomerase-like TIM barrel [Planctopirus ephydatiae]